MNSKRNHMDKSAIKAGKRAANPRATSCRAPISAKETKVDVRDSV
jgi:hypothetical protein